MRLKRRIIVIAVCIFAFPAAAETAPASATAPPVKASAAASRVCAFTSAAEARGISDGDCAVAPAPRMTTPPSGPCVHTSTAKALGISDDGCALAPAGAPQLPALLQAYHNRRPKWDVAGVDYYVGVPTGTFLKDPVAAPDGCSYDDSVLTLQCKGDGLVVSGYDFSLHGGTKIKISGSNNTITNNKFAQAPNCRDPLIHFTIEDGGSLNVSQNSFDGGGGACTDFKFSNVIFGLYGDKSKLTMQYNYFYGTPQNVINNTGPKSGSAALVMRYNLFDAHGYQGHVVQFNGGNFTGSAVNFNTYNNPYRTGAESVTQPFHIESQLTAAIDKTTVAYNTLITSGSCNGGRNYPVGCSANIGISCKQNSGSNSNTGFSAYGNYIDWSGAIAALSDKYSCPSSTWGKPLPNVDLRTGSAITVSPLDGATVPIRREFGRKGS
jgi:hypothetical protein